MIHTNRVVTVGDQESIIDKPIILYRGDREVEVEFELIGNEFMFSTNGNVIKSVNASHGQLVLNTPSGDNMFSELAECHDGKVVFVITKEMIDEFIEIGFYSFQIRLYDGEQMKSRVTIPPVFSGIDIRNPIAAEDETNVVGMAVVDYARIYRDQSNEELPTFDWQGNYIKTDWVHHDVITENKMNKIEDGLWTINNKISESDNVFLKKAEDMEKQRQNDVNKLNTKDTQLTNDIQNVNRNLTNAVNTLRVDMEVGDETIKSELTRHIDLTTMYVTPEMFDGADDTERFTKALSSGKNVLLTNKTYTMSKSINVPKGVEIKGINSPIIYPNRTAQFNLLGNNTIDGIIIDGQNDQYIGLQIQGSNITIKNCTIKNILYSASYCIRDYSINSLDGLIYKNINIHHCIFDNIAAIDNGVQGDGPGACRAIALSYSKYINIYNNIFTNLQGYEDSDYIHIASPRIDVYEYPYNESQNYKNSDVYCNIYNNTFENFKKAGVKIQASSCKIYHNTFVTNEKTTMAMRGYSGSNVEFTDNRIHYDSPTSDNQNVWLNGIWQFEFFKDLVIRGNVVTGDCGTFEQLIYARYVDGFIFEDNIINMPNSRSRNVNNSPTLCVFRITGKNIKIIRNNIHINAAIAIYYMERLTNLTEELFFEYLLESNHIEAAYNYAFATMSNTATSDVKMLITAKNDVMIKNGEYATGLSNVSSFNHFTKIYFDKCDYRYEIFRMYDSNSEFTNSIFQRVQIQDGLNTTFNGCIFKNVYESITINNAGKIRIMDCHSPEDCWMFVAYRAYKDGDKLEIINQHLPINTMYNGSSVVRSIDRMLQYSWANIPVDKRPETIYIDYHGELQGYSYGSNAIIPKFTVPINSKYYDTTNNKELRFDGTAWN